MCYVVVYVCLKHYSFLDLNYSLFLCCWISAGGVFWTEGESVFWSVLGGVCLCFLCVVSGQKYGRFDLPPGMLDVITNLVSLSTLEFLFWKSDYFTNSYVLKNYFKLYRPTWAISYLTSAIVNSKVSTDTEPPKLSPWLQVVSLVQKQFLCLTPRWTLLRTVRQFGL